MAGKITFTDDRVRKLKPPAKGRKYYYDAKQPGLELSVTHTGSKSWYLNRWHDGRAVRKKIDDFPAINTTEARRRVAKMISEQGDGVDLMARAKARRNAPTLQVAFDNWLEHAKAHKRTWPDDQRQFNKYLAGWHNKRLDSITTQDVTAWHSKIGADHGPIQANRTLALLATLFHRADRVGFNGRNPCDGVDRFPERIRERYLSADELKPFFTALAAEPPLWRDFFLVAILTGVRRGNIATMRWSAVDLANGLWHIPATESKNKKPLAITLSPPAVAILRARWQENPGEYVFPSNGRNGRYAGHAVDPRKAWKRITEASGIKDLRMHDLRRTLGSMMATAGVPLQVIGRALGHSEIRTTEKVYAHLTVDPIRQAVADTGAAIIKAGGKAAKKLLGRPSEPK